MKYLLIFFTFLFLSTSIAQITWEQVYFSDNEIVVRIHAPDSLDCIALIDRMGFCKLIHSTDGGNQWDTIYDETYWGPPPQKFPNPQHVFNMQYPANGYLYLSYEKGIVKRSRDRAKSFDTTYLPVNLWMKYFHMKDSITGVLASSQTLFITEDGWETWEQADVEWEKYIVDVWMHSIDTFAFTSSHGILGPIYYRTTDRGKTWKEQKLKEGKGGLRKIFFLNDSIGWIAASEPNFLGDQKFDVLYKTTDGGAVWELAYRQENYKIFGLQDVAFVDEQNGIAVGQFNKILRTTDGGDSWVQDTIAIGQGATLIPTMTIGYLGTKPLIGTFSSGMYGIPATTGIEYQTSKPGAILAYPNPFTDYVNFKLDVPMLSTEVKIEIWDFAGRPVESETLNASGSGVIRFRPGANSAGLYFYSITIDGNIFSGTVVRE